MISPHFRLPHPALDGPGGCGWDAIVKTAEGPKTKMLLFYSCKICPLPPYTHPAAPDKAIEKKYPRQIGLHSAQRL